MGLLNKGWPQEQGGQSHRSKAITAGSHVVVREGRHFPAFGAGDEGVVIRADEEAQNCDVLFAGKSQPVTVALRHLRLLSSPRESSATEATTIASVPDPNGVLAQEDSFRGSEPWSAFSSSPVRADAGSPPSLQCNSLLSGNGIALLTEPVADIIPMAAVIGSSKPCDYMDSAAGFAAGVAAVSGMSPGSEGSKSSLVHGAMVGVDLNHNGMADLIIAGADANRDGIPDALQHSAPTHLVPGAMVGLDLNRNGSADVIVAGPDHRGEGMPDCFHQDSNREKVANVPAPGTLQALSTLQEEGWPNGHCRCGPIVAEGPSWCGPRVAAPEPTSVHYEPVALQANSQRSSSRFEVLEARLANVEIEHRSEVASLRHALEECVLAIGTCTRAIDAMCYKGPESQRFPGDSNVYAEWESTAATLRNAAGKGLQALRASPGHYSGIGAGTGGGVRPIHRASSCGGLQSSRRSHCGASGMATPGSNSGSITVPSGGSSMATPVSVEVVATEPRANQDGMEAAIRRARSGSPGCGGASAAQRRYLMASPTSPSPAHRVPVMIATGDPGSPSMPSGAVSPGHVGMAGARYPGCGTGMPRPPQAPFSPVPMMPAWGSASAPVTPPPGVLYRQQQQQKLAPPESILGNIPGFPALGSTGVVPNGPMQGGMLTPNGPRGMGFWPMPSQAMMQ